LFDPTGVTPPMGLVIGTGCDAADVSQAFPAQEFRFMCDTVQNFPGRVLSCLECTAHRLILFELLLATGG
jgi:hypothetical protein